MSVTNINVAYLNNFSQCFTLNIVKFRNDENDPNLAELVPQINGIKYFILCRTFSSKYLWSLRFELLRYQNATFFELMEVDAVLIEHLVHLPPVVDIDDMTSEERTVIIITQTKKVALWWKHVCDHN